MNASIIPELQAYNNTMLPFTSASLKEFTNRTQTTIEMAKLDPDQKAAAIYGEELLIRATTTAELHQEWRNIQTRLNSIFTNIGDWDGVNIQTARDQTKISEIINVLIDEVKKRNKFSSSKYRAPSVCGEPWSHVY